jgi:hypothetical protein
MTSKVSSTMWACLDSQVGLLHFSLRFFTNVARTYRKSSALSHYYIKDPTRLMEPFFKPVRFIPDPSDLYLSLIIASCNPPEICYPTSKDQAHQRPKANLTQPLHLAALLAVTFLSASNDKLPLVHQVSSSQPLFSCPLQAANIDIDRARLTHRRLRE